MIVTRFPAADVPVLIGGRDFRIYTVEADPEFQAMLIEREAEFWRLVENGTPPAPVNYNDVVRLYRKSESKQITATAEIEQYVEGLRKLRGELDKLAANETELKRRIMEAMGEADTLTDPAGKVLAKWKSSKDNEKFNMEFFKKNHKDLFDKYLQTHPGSRRFLLKGEAKNGSTGNV
jgi:predicted phage-related endonuclease